MRVRCWVLCLLVDVLSLLRSGILAKTLMMTSKRRDGYSFEHCTLLRFCSNGASLCDSSRLSSTDTESEDARLDVRTFLVWYATVIKDD